MPSIIVDQFVHNIEQHCEVVAAQNQWLSHLLSVLPKWAWDSDTLASFREMPFLMLYVLGRCAEEKMPLSRIGGSASDENNIQTVFFRAFAVPRFTYPDGLAAFGGHGRPIQYGQNFQWVIGESDERREANPEEEAHAKTRILFSIEELTSPRNLTSAKSRVLMDTWAAVGDVPFPLLPTIIGLLANELSVRPYLESTIRYFFHCEGETWGFCRSNGSWWTICDVWERGTSVVLEKGDRIIHFEGAYQVE